MEAEQARVDAIPVNNEQENKEDLDELDDFEAMDEEEEKLMRNIKAQRLAAMKEDYEETQTNKTLGHGQYDEIEEASAVDLDIETSGQHSACQLHLNPCA